MNIKEISETIIRGEKAIVFPLILNNGNWITDQSGHHILDIRGWGYIQYADKNAEKIQDGIAEWIVKTLNEKWEQENKN